MFADGTEGGLARVACRTAEDGDIGLGLGVVGWRATAVASTCRRGPRRARAARAAPALQHRLRGLDRADSLAFDLHKWGFLQYEVGCVLCRDAAAQRAAFETRASYLASPGRGIQPTSLELADMGIQLSRGFRALKVWMSLQTHGVDDPTLDALNREILLRIQEAGIAVPSSTLRSGRFALRVAITNHRSRRADFAALVDAVVELGDRLAGPM